MPMTITQTRDFINTWIRNDARLSFTDLRLNTALISLLDNIELLVIGAGGEPTIAPGTTSQYWRGDKTWQTLNKTAVGLSNVQNVDQTNATNLTSGTIDAARYGALTIPVGAINATGTPGATTVLYGNGTWGTPTIPDGDYGGITIGGSGTTMTINAGVVTYAMLQDIPEDRVLGRVLPGTGPVTALTGSDITPLLDLFTSTTAGIVPLSGGGTTNFLRADGTWAAPAGSGGIADGDYGDITASSGGTVLTVDNSAITLAKMANIATARFIGRITAGTGVPEALTGTEATSLLDVFSTTAKGLVPVASGGSETTQFLRKDGTWAVPAGGGGGSGTVNSGTQYRIAYYATTGTAVSEAAAITASRALISDANGVPTHSSVTSTELGYVSGVTSAIQTQLNAKQDTLVSGTNIKTVNSVSLLGSGDVVTPNFATDNLTFTGNRVHSLTTYALMLDRQGSTDYDNTYLELNETYFDYYHEHSSGKYTQLYLTADNTDAGTFAYFQAIAGGTAYVEVRGTGLSLIGGSLRLPNYNTSVPGTAVYSLNVDASGNVITGSVGGGGYTDEQAQDAVGAMVSGEFTYTDATPLLEINAINWSKITGEPSTFSGYGITEGLDAILAINRVTNDFIDWQEASDASGSGVYSQKITPSNYNTAYTSHGRASLYTTGWMRFNGVNVSGRPNVVRSDGYNINMGGSRILTDEAGFRTALESHFEQGADDLFEWFHEITTYGGTTSRPMALYINKTNGQTALNFLATQSVTFQTTGAANLFGFNSTGNYAFEGSAGTLTLYNGTTSDEAYQLQVDNTTVYHNSFGLLQQYDAGISIIPSAGGNYPLSITVNSNGGWKGAVIGGTRTGGDIAPFEASMDSDGLVNALIANVNTGTAAEARLTFGNSANSGYIAYYSTTHATDPNRLAFINDDGALAFASNVSYLYFSSATSTVFNPTTDFRILSLSGTGNRLVAVDADGDLYRTTVDPGSLGGGGGEDLEATLTVDNDTGGIPIIHTTASGTNRAFQIYARSAADNFAIATMYPDTGTNVSQYLQVIPKGTGGSGIDLWATDLIADSTNYSALQTRWTSTDFTINSMAAGSGTVFGLNLQTAGSTRLGITGAGVVYINNTRFQTDLGTNTAAANDLTLPADGNMFTITGNTQINAITSANWQAGSEITLLFTGTPTLKHNTAGGAGTAKLLMGGSSDFTAAADDVVQFVFDGTNWHETYRKNAAVGGRYNFSNGLTETGINVKLGGTLTANTTIAAAGFNLIISTSTASANPLIVNSTSGTGIDVNSTTGTGLDVSTTTGTGVQATTTGSNYGIKAAIHNASTNGIIGGMQIFRTTTGTAANGLGSSLDFTNQASDGSTPSAARIVAVNTTTTVGSFTAALDLYTTHSTTNAARMRLDGEGISLYNAASAPTTSVSNGIRLYSEDVAASAELKVRDEAGNITTISPHNFSGIPDGPSEKLAWAHYGEKDGEFVNVDMLKLARILENEYGWKYGQLVYTGKK